MTRRQIALAIALIAIPSMCGLALIAGVVLYGRVVRTPTAARTPITTATPRGLTYGQICDGRVAMTDLQWQQHLASYVGQRVTWTGQVYEVQEHYSGGYMLYIALQDERRFDVMFKVPADQAAQLDKHQVVRFTGTIRSIEKSSVGCLYIELAEAALE